MPPGETGQGPFNLPAPDCLRFLQVSSTARLGICSPVRGCGPARATTSASREGEPGGRSNDLSFDSLRHSVVSLLKTAAIAESVVMELLGHDGVEASRHYTRTGREALKAAAQALPEL
jgi:integrase